MKTALLLSGGIDSLSLLYMLQPDIAVTVDYGQKPAAAEIEASQAACTQLSIEHEVVEIGCSQIGAGSMAVDEGVTWTTKLSAAPEWWPYRNQLIITVAAAYVVKRSVESLIIGTVKGDQRHGDGTANFVHLMDSLLQAQEGRLRLSAPAIEMTSSELVRQSKAPKSLIAWSHSCHTSNIACGTCRGCLKHSEVMMDLGW